MTIKQNLPAVAGPVERRVMQFDELALGARFIYADSPEKNQQIWIKIRGEGCGIIAEYDENRIGDKNWIGQHICSAKDYENEDVLVEFIA